MKVQVSVSFSVGPFVPREDFFHGESTGSISLLAQGRINIQGVSGASATVREHVP